MSKRRYVYYQPNKMDIKDEYGDCTIRALSKAMNCTWLEAFDATIPIMRKYQVSSVFNAPVKVKKELLGILGFEYKGVSNARGSKRPTVDSFAKDHPTGTYILKVAHHVVACVNGKFYDTWDSGECSMYGYYVKVR